MYVVGLTRFFSVPGSGESDPGLKRRVPRVVWIGHDGSSLRRVWSSTAAMCTIPGVGMNADWRDPPPPTWKMVVSFGGPSESASSTYDTVGGTVAETV